MNIFRRLKNIWELGEYVPRPSINLATSVLQKDLGSLAKTIEAEAKKLATVVMVKEEKTNDSTD